MAIRTTEFSFPLPHTSQSSVTAAPSIRAKAVSWKIVLFTLFPLISSAIILYLINTVEPGSFSPGFLYLPIILLVAYRYSRRLAAVAMLFHLLMCFGIYLYFVLYVPGFPPRPYTWFIGLWAFVFAATAGFVIIQAYQKQTQLLTALKTTHLDEQEYIETIDAALSNMPDGLVILDADATVAYWPEHLDDLLHFNGEEALRINFGQVFQQLLPQIENADEIEQEVKDAVWNHKDNGIILLQMKGPPISYVKMRVFGIQGSAEETLGIGLLFSDVTEQVEVDRMKSDFVAVASHEMRTPLTTIAGFIDLVLMRRYDEEKQRQCLEEARAQVRRLTGIITQFLDLSRIEQGQIKLETQPIRPFSLIYEAVEASRPQVLEIEQAESIDEEPKHELKIVCSAELPLVMADSARVIQILENLINNAVKYSPAGGLVTVEARQKNNKVLFSITDTGLGIPPEEQIKLFQPFYRAEYHRRVQIGGNGLGLSIVKRLVERLGGEVWLESVPNSGTTVYFTLPVASE